MLFLLMLVQLLEKLCLGVIHTWIYHNLNDVPLIRSAHLKQSVTLGGPPRQVSVCSPLQPPCFRSSPQSPLVRPPLLDPLKP